MKKDNPPSLIPFSICVVVGVITFTFLWPSLPLKSLTAEAYSAMAAFFSVMVALIALYISYYQIQSTAKSARLSIKPHCIFINVIANMEGEPLGIGLRNNGLGPAIIVAWTFSINGKMIPERNQDGINVIINRYHLNRLVYGRLLPPGSSLGANQIERIIYLPIEFNDKMVFGEPSKTANAAMDGLMKEVNVHLKFKSAYDEEDSISSLENIPV
jgi:hypothetical protein